MDWWIGGSEHQVRRRLFFFALAIPLPMVLFYFEVGSDVGGYYLPMTRAFAHGNFDAAYYPMIPPLMATVAGTVSFAKSLLRQ